MTTLTLDIPSDVYKEIQQEAERAGQAIEAVATAWLAERVQPVQLRNDHLPVAPSDERERARAVLRTAGLLTELGSALKQRAEQSTASLEEVQAAFARAGGKPLSEIVIETRGPRD